MTDKHKDPAESDDLDDFLRGVHPDDIRKGTVEDLQEMMAKMKADVEEQEGDTWENLEKKHGAQMTVQTRLMNAHSTGRRVSAEEVERLITTPGSTSKTPFLGLPTDFQYTPLPAGYFRLLTIRGLGDFPIVELEAFPMEGAAGAAAAAAPAYVAISYAWGKEVSSRAFYCNGRTFAVPAHVLDALNHLGLKWMDEKIWIDAICINQGDDEEKAAQVACMQRIYHRAEKVVVWLGAAEDESDVVLQNMDAFLDWSLKVREYGVTPDQPGYRMLNPPPDSICLALGRFLKRPWFHRVWVVQEMLLAREAVLVCGGGFVNWETFCSAVLVMSENRLAYLLDPHHGVPTPLVAVAIANIDELNRLSKKGRDGLGAVDFTKLLKMGRFRKVTEPVDRVFGFLGLANEEILVAAAPIINYSPERKREYYKTYADIGKLLLQTDPELYLLSIVPSASRPPGMPSWCPNLHAAGLSGSSIQSQENFNFHAGHAQGAKGDEPIVKFGPDSYTLRLQGFRLDRVDRTATVHFLTPSSWEEERIQGATHPNLAAWDRQCHALARAAMPAASAMAVLDAHWRTLSFDQMADVPGNEVRVAYLNFLNFVRGKSTWRPGNLTLEARRNVGRFIRTVGKSCSRAYFSTVGGRIGLGPRNLAAGDWVCIVHGAKVPYILRSRPSRTEMEFVGDSYVDGVMYGESLTKGLGNEVFSID